MVTIQLQRRGVSHSLTGTFNPCEHGHAWYIEVVDYQGRKWLANIHRPNCPNCVPVGERIGRAWGIREASSIEDVKRTAATQIAELLGEPVEFSPFIQAYCCYDDHDHRLHPHLRTDKYITCATYEPDTDTIRHEPTNVCLVAFNGPTVARFDVDAAAAKYLEPVHRAYVEFLKEHNQRNGERRAKVWFAWLAGQYIRKMDGEQPVVVDRIERVSTASPEAATAPAA